MRDTFADILKRHAPSYVIRGRSDDAPVGPGVCVIAREPTPRNYVPLEVIEAANGALEVAKSRVDKRSANGERNVVAILFLAPDRRERSVLRYAIQNVLP